MNYKVTGTLEEMTALEQEIFVYGAPFSAITYGQIWDDFLEQYFANESKIGGVSAWQGVTDEEDGAFSIIHIDMFSFSEKPLLNMLQTSPKMKNNKQKHKRRLSQG